MSPVLKMKKVNILHAVQGPTASKWQLGFEFRCRGF